jgi:hypothetical protein
MDLKLSYIQIDSVNIALMAMKYTELYPNESKDWKNFGLERLNPESNKFKLAWPKGWREAVGVFEVIDKEKFLWAIMQFDIKYIVYNP